MTPTGYFNDIKKLLIFKTLLRMIVTVRQGLYASTILLILCNFTMLPEADIFNPPSADEKMGTV